MEKKHIKILALDIATHTGWSLGNELYGVWNLRQRHDENWGSILLRFRGKLLEVLDQEQPDLLVYERPAGRHTQAIITESKLIGVAESLCEERGIAYRAYAASEIKKFATGKGNARKMDMVKTARLLYGMQGVDDNIADAMHLYHLADKEYNNRNVKGKR